MERKSLMNYKINLPPLQEQKAIADTSSCLDDKIELNQKMNKNLEEQAQAIFDDMFGNTSIGEVAVSKHLMPKRGKGLLSKNAINRDVPVVAGGLEPATYHNESNTMSPVITISSSSANDGFVRLWEIPVWSSDSSYIDETVNENVYFWYVLLKKDKEKYTRHKLDLHNLIFFLNILEKCH